MGGGGSLGGIPMGKMGGGGIGTILLVLLFLFIQSRGGGGGLGVDPGTGAFPQAPGASATDGIDGSTGSGRTAFEQSAATLPGVSAPSRVVRSIIRTASSKACSLDSFLIERLASVAARSSSATASTEPIRGSLGSIGSSKPRGSAGAWAMGKV